ncbi:MAG: hypothetical protein K0S29_786 [Gammaproteobacteria bacterium]|nr:hypothetical protein [Gammaproteobacteria bacterium]
MFRRAFILLNAIAAVSQGAVIEADKKESESENATTPLSVLLDAQGNIRDKPDLSKFDFSNPLVLSALYERSAPLLSKIAEDFLDQTKRLPSLPTSEQIKKMIELTDTALDKANASNFDKKAYQFYDEAIEKIIARCNDILLDIDLDLQDKQSIILILENAGKYYFSRGMRRSAELTLKTSLILNESLYGKDSTQVAVNLRWLAKAERELGNTDIEIELLTRAFMIIEAKKPNSLEHVRILFRLALAEYDKYGNVARRNKPLKRAAKMLKQLPADPYSASLGVEIAQALLESQDTALAFDLFTTASLPIIKQGTIEFEDITSWHVFEGQLFLNPSQGRAKIEAALASLEKQYGPQHYRILPSIESLVGMSELPEEKMYWLERGLKICKKAFGKDHINVAIYLDKMCTYSKDQNEIRQWATEALRIFELNHAPLHVYSVNAYAVLGYLEMGSKPSSALKYLQRAVEIAELENCNLPGFCIENWVKISSLQYRLGQKDEAIQTIQKAVAMANQRLGKDHPLTKHAMVGLTGMTKEETGRTFEKIIKAHKKNTTQSAVPR